MYCWNFTLFPCENFSKFHVAFFEIHVRKKWMINQRPIVYIDHQSKQTKKQKKQNHSPRNGKACHTISASPSSKDCYNAFTRKEIKRTKLKGARRKKPHKPKPEEQEGMPHYQHCPPAKCREDRNPEYYEEKHEDVA
jgi:hypothetical protein